jgi:hypothetical protein
MERFCQNCQSPTATKKCSKCVNMYYCSKECQIKHWPLHKYLCGRNGASIKEQTQAIADGVLHFNFLNPRTDRTLEKHGADTHQIAKLDHHSKKFIHLMELDTKKCKMMLIDKNILLPYGLCVQNVNSVITKKGGKAVRGWSLWEGKHLIEAEFHVVWVPPDDNVFINVTETIEHLPYSGMFIPDSRLDILNKAPSNIIYWKE